MPRRTANPEVREIRPPVSAAPGTAEEGPGKEYMFPEEGKDGAGISASLSGNGLVTVVSPQRAGKSVTGVTGEIITFDGSGKAEVCSMDAEHFRKIPGFRIG